MRKYAVIVAGGSGSRMGGGMPKQFRSLCGRPVLWWSIKAFHEEDHSTTIILVLPKDFIGLWDDFYATLPDEERYPYLSAPGGDTRTESVKSGLSLVSEEEEALVAVHDGARPLVSASLVAEGWKRASEEGAAVPVVKVTDSLRRLSGEKSESVPREEYVSVQTPQVFKSRLLKESYLQTGDDIFTDDASVVEHAGHKICLFAGSADNIKITHPKDMAIAEILIGKDA